MATFIDGDTAVFEAAVNFLPAHEDDFNFKPGKEFDAFFGGFFYLSAEQSPWTDWNFVATGRFPELDLYGGVAFSTA